MRRRGSITVFASLVIMLVANFLFALLEASRYTELSKVAEMRANADIESVFSQYCIPLYESYGLLGYDCQGTNVEWFLKDLSEAGLAESKDLFWKKRLDLLRLSMDSADVSSYTLITDGDGAVYEASVAAYMRETLAYGTAQAVYDTYMESAQMEAESGDVDKNVDDAVEQLEQLQQSEDAEEDTDERIEDDTFGTVKEAKASGVLALVLGSDASVSGNTINISDNVSNRSLSHGANQQVPDTDWLDYVCMEQYIIQNMGNYTKPSADHALSYEAEYIIAGKAGDSDNLKTVIHELILTREAANFIYLQSDYKKKEEALALATAIAGASANPVVITAVKQGLLASWAYCESVLDVRTLLDGDKVPLVKTQATWTSNLSEIAALLSGQARAKSVTTGMSYTEFLGTLLMLKGTKNMAYRSMDIEEATIRSVAGYDNFRMDNVISGLNISFDYSYNPVFYNYTSNQISKSVDYSYISRWE